MVDFGTILWRLFLRKIDEIHDGNAIEIHHGGAVGRFLDGCDCYLRIIPRYSSTTTTMQSVLRSSGLSGARAPCVYPACRECVLACDCWGQRLFALTHGQITGVNQRTKCVTASCWCSVLRPPPPSSAPPLLSVSAARVNFWYVCVQASCLCIVSAGPVYVFESGDLQPQ